MKHYTYQVLKRAHLGDVDPEALDKVQNDETDPFILRTIHLVTKTAPLAVQWDEKPFTTDFRSITARERLDQTVLTFLLRLAVIVKEEMYMRSFRKPESCTVVIAWRDLLKECMFTVLTLAYNVRWTSEQFLQLDAVILDLLYVGRSAVLREFIENNLKITLKACPTEAERLYESLNFLNIAQFGSSFWRLLHWMAEAIEIRSPQNNPDVLVAKDCWKRLVSESLYRALRCNICMQHMKQLMLELKPQLFDDSVNYATLWFNIHNKVNMLKTHQFQMYVGMKDSQYKEEDYNQDSVFMRQALSVE